MTVLYLGLVCWISTKVLTESELFRPLREWVYRQARPKQLTGWGIRRPDGTILWLEGSNYTPREDSRYEVVKPTYRSRPVRAKLAYLVGCPLCTGVWVGFVLSAVFPDTAPWSGFPGLVAAGLLYTAAGHLVLELRPQAWYQRDMHD